MDVAGWGWAFDCGVSAAWAHPLLPFAIGGLAVWWVAGPRVSESRTGILAGAAREVLLPLVTGLSIVCIVLACLRVAGPAVDPSTVGSVELALARVRLSFERVFGLSLERLLIVGTALLIGLVLFARLAIVSQFRRFQAAVGSAQLVLLALTSFVIYAQGGLQTELDHAHQRIVADYRAALDEQWSADSVTAAARAVKRSVQSMTMAQQHQLAAALHDANDAAGGDTLTEMAIDADVFAPAFAPRAPPVVPVEPAAPVDPPPRSGRELDAELRAVAQREAAASAAQTRSGQAVMLTETGLVSLLSILTPLPHPWLKAALDALIASGGDAIADRVIERSSEDAQSSLSNAELASVQPPAPFLDSTLAAGPAEIRSLVASELPPAHSTVDSLLAADIESRVEDASAEK